MILLGEEFAFLTRVSDEGGSVARSAETARDQMIVRVLLRHLLLREKDGCLVITESGQHVLAIGEVRECASIRYVQIPEPIVPATGD